MGLKGEIDIFKARLANLRKRTRSFTTIYPWIFRDFLGFAWRKALVLLAIAGISAGFRVAVVATLLGTVRKLAKPDSSSAADGLIDIPYIGSVDYVIFGGLILVFLALNAGINFAFERAVFRTAASYQPLILKRSLEVFAGLPNLYRDIDLPLRDRQSLVSSIGRHARLVTIFLRIILFASLNFMAAVACYLALLAINTYITSIFTLVIVLFLPVFYYLSLKGIRMRERTPIAVGNLLARLRLLNQELQSPVPMDRKDSDRIIGNLVDGPIAHDAFEAFLQQRFVIFKAQLASGILAAVILALSITIFFASFRHEDAFGDDFALFFALLFVMGMSLAGSLRALVSGNRFFGTLKFFYILIGPGGQKQHLEAPSEGSDLAYRRLKGDVLPLAPKSDVYVYIQGTKQRFEFHLLVNRLLPFAEQRDAEDGSLIYLNDPEADEPDDLTRDRHLVFVAEKVLSAVRGGQRGRTAFLKRIYGDKVRFIVLREPLAAKPKSRTPWLYVWGTPDRLIGDLASGEEAKLPKPDALRKRLDDVKKKSRRGGAIDPDELDL